MPSDNLRLWSNTVQLFYEYKHEGFVGPFKRAGLNYSVEVLMRTEEGAEKKPDIVASGDSGWLALELTTNPDSKAPKLDQYRRLAPEYLGIHGLPVHQKAPDVMTSRLSRIDDGPNCQIIVLDNLELYDETYIKNKDLRTALVESRGVSLERLPTISITMLPGMGSSELREGLVDIVMQLFEPGSLGKTPTEIVDDGLERLADRIGVHDHYVLIGHVQEELDALLKNHLGDYLEFAEGVYRATKDWKEHYANREMVVTKLRDWMAQKRLTDYPGT